jgi:hypothetical protein
MKLVPGGHKGRTSIAVNVLNVACVIYSVLKDVLNRIPRDILKLIFFTVKGVLSVPENAGLKLLQWQRKKNNGQ